MSVEFPAPNAHLPQEALSKDYYAKLTQEIKLKNAHYQLVHERDRQRNLQVQRDFANCVTVPTQAQVAKLQEWRQSLARDTTRKYQLYYSGPAAKRLRRTQLVTDDGMLTSVPDDQLVPVRIDISLRNGYRLRDQFMWNANEEHIEVDKFASGMCEDFAISTEQYAPVIAQQIQMQLDDFRTYGVDTGAVEQLQQANRQELRVEIKLNVVAGDQIMQDTIELDVHGLTASRISYLALLICAELTGDCVTAVQSQISEQLQQHRKSLVCAEYQFDGVEVDLGISQWYLPPLDSGLKSEPSEAAVQARLTDVELERILQQDSVMPQLSRRRKSSGRPKRSVAIARLAAEIDDDADDQTVMDADTMYGFDLVRNSDTGMLQVNALPDMSRPMSSVRTLVPNDAMNAQVGDGARRLLSLPAQVDDAKSTTKTKKKSGRRKSRAAAVQAQSQIKQQSQRDEYDM